MKKLRPSFLLISFFAICFHFAEAQSKISVGVGVIAAQIEGGVADRSIEDIKPKEGYTHFNPAIGCSYELHFNRSFFVSGNANFSISKVPYYTFSFELDFDELVYKHQSINVLFNYKLKNFKESSPFNLNLGIGSNLNYYKDFSVISRYDFIPNLELGKAYDRYELGFIYHLSTDIKNIKLAFNHALGAKLYQNIEGTIKASNWYSISASYIFILNE